MIIKPKFKVPPEFTMYCLDQGLLTRKIEVQRTKVGADTPTGIFNKLSNLKRTKIGAETPAGGYSYQKTSGGGAITDNFNRADENPLAGNWETVGAGALQLSSNAVKASGSSILSASGWKSSVNPFNANQYSKVQFTGIHIYDEGGVTVRGTAGSNGTYYASIYKIGAAELSISKVINGTLTELTNGACTLSLNDTIKLQVSGTTLTAYQNTTQICTIVDSSISSGQPGLFYDYGDANTTVLDNWEGGNL